MPEALPQFKFFQDPLGQGAFKSTQAPCPCCGETRGLGYQGTPHGASEVENLCPYCIASGKAAEKFDLTFIDDWGLDEVTEESRKELTERTPGIITWQTENWPSHCQEPCSFVAYVGSKELQDLKVDVEEDLEDQAEEFGMTLKEFKKALVNQGSLQGYLFQCVHCGRHRLTVDCD